MIAVFVAAFLLTLAGVTALLLLLSVVMCVVHIRQKRRARLTPAPQSISTPLGLKAYRDVNTHASLAEGVYRASKRCYVPKGDE